MKLIRYVLLSVLVFVLAIATPARTQTVDVSQLPIRLNTALCVNDWNRASTMVQQLLSSDLTPVASKQQLIILQRQIEQYRSGNLSIDQSDACAAAVASGFGNGNTIRADRPGSSANSNVANRPNSTRPNSANPAIATCNSGYASIDGRCLSNQTAARRHNRSWELGDRPSSN
jgi:hypothetical protein